jgi:hypothetical protein
VNHKVHLFISGCLTLKCSGSWKTVTGSVLLEKSSDGLSLEPLLPTTPSGEIGMVSRGTGWDATSVMVGECVCAFEGDGRCMKSSVQGFLHRAESGAGSGRKVWVLRVRVRVSRTRSFVVARMGALFVSLRESWESLVSGLSSANTSCQEVAPHRTLKALAERSLAALMSPCLRSTTVPPTYWPARLSKPCTANASIRIRLINYT